MVVLGTKYILDSFSELLKSLLSKCFKIRLLNLMDLKSDVRTLIFCGELWGFGMSVNQGIGTKS